MHSSQRTGDGPSARREEIVPRKGATHVQSLTKKSAHDQHIFWETYCCQHDVQSKINLRLSGFTDQGQVNGESDRVHSAVVLLELLDVIQHTWSNSETHCVCPTWHTTHLSDFNFCWCSTQEVFIISVHSTDSEVLQRRRTVKKSRMHSLNKDVFQ